MIAAVLIAASVLAPSGVTAGIQASPVCLPVTAQPGHSYPLTVYVSGSVPLALSVTPAHGTLERSLHQVPGSWVRFAANPASTGMAGFTLAVPPGAAPGAYWSDVEAGTQGHAQSGGGGHATLGAAATTAFVFTVGPSATPPPPCDALTLAQSTGKFPAWPTPAFKTTSWKQVFARDSGGPVTPNGGPTASAAAGRTSAVPAAQYAPAGPPASARWAAATFEKVLVGIVVIGVILGLLAGRRSS